MSSSARHFAILCIPIAIGSSVRGEVDDVGAALALARLHYEEKVQAIRDEVLEKIGTKQAALRAKSKPKLEEIAELESARTAFITSGRWPTFRNFNDCQTKLRKAAKGMDDAFAKAETGYLKSGHDAAAKSIRAEHEQFLKECDIGSWSDNLLASWKDEQRIIGTANKTIDVGAFTTGPYRMELIAQSVDGDGILTLEFPVPGKKRIDITTLPVTGTNVHILLSVRESLVSSDLGVARPVSDNMREDDAPPTLVLGCSRGSIRMESVRFKPILTAAAGDRTLAAEPDLRPAHSIAAEDDAAGLLPPKKSRWRGYGWHGQNPHDLKKTLVTDATMTLDENGRIEIQTDGWESCSQVWVFQLREKRLILAEIHSKCRFDQFTEVQGDGLLDEETLQFRSSARVAGHSINAIVYSRFELRRIQDD